MSRHDPGGRHSRPLQPGVYGKARFSGKRDEYRLWLSRAWGDGAPELFSPERDRFSHLWIGMNPSTADGMRDDPTVQKECWITAQDGGRRYVKMNVMDYRATKPAMLAQASVSVCSNANLRMIREMAARADKIVLAFGRLVGYRAFGAEVVRRLVRDDRELWCLGTNSDGSPKHPVFLRKDSRLIRFQGALY